MTIALQAGDWSAELRPEIGGSLAALRHRGIEVLRTMPAGSADVLEAACFPLVPYCNRIRGGRFRFGDRQINLPANFAPEPHSLHGLGWQSAWKIESQADGECVLIHEYDACGQWPWAYGVRQNIRLGPTGCAITLVLTNDADEAMPAGLGLHPYLRRRAETLVRFAADHLLLSGAEPLPTGVTAPAAHFADFAAGSLLPTETVDHCFVGWSGQAMVQDDLGTIAIRAEGAPHMHLYAPSDGSALCLEPVTHTPDAPNRAPQEMIALSPGSSASLTMLISAS